MICTPSWESVVRRSDIYALTHDLGGDVGDTSDSDNDGDNDS